MRFSSDEEEKPLTEDTLFGDIDLGSSPHHIRFIGFGCGHRSDDWSLSILERPPLAYTDNSLLLDQGGQTTLQGATADDVGQGGMQIIDADLQGSRRLVVSHRVRNGVMLERANCERTLYHLARLWGYRVKLVEVDAESGKVLKEHENLRMP